MAEFDETVVSISEETEELIEALFADARNSAIDKNPHNHRGRVLDEIDADIAEVRKALSMEL